MRKVIVPKKRKVKLSLIVHEDYIGEEMEVIAFTRKEGLQSLRMPNRFHLL